MTKYTIKRAFQVLLEIVGLVLQTVCPFGQLFVERRVVSFEQKDTLRIPADLCKIVQSWET